MSFMLGEDLLERNNCTSGSSEIGHEVHAKVALTQPAIRHCT
jgi:hypothetical protein